VTGIPALVVSGFLGAGKTTLVRHLLRDAQRAGVRVAVVTNEFGELGVDRALLGDGEQAYVELDGGCVCCQLGDELVETLDMLRRRVEPERVIVETSGVALPYDTQLHFFREPVSGWVSECLGVVVVNTEQLRDGRDVEGTFTDQVTSADLLVLNQIDRVPPGELDALEARLREIEPEAPLVRARHALVEPAVLFPEPGARDGEPHAAARGPRPHVHEPFECSELPVPTGVDPDALAGELAALGALRVKGFVRTRDGLRLVQGVGPRVELVAVEAAPDEALVGRLVVIRRAPPQGSGDAQGSG
jgi:cobalamin biosynthesis protein CobW